MEKGLKITESHYLNMDNIIEWWICSDGSVEILTVSADCERVTISSDLIEGNDRRTFKVSVNELHRIKREIGEYMGITYKEHLSSVKELS